MESTGREGREGRGEKEERKGEGEGKSCVMAVTGDGRPCAQGSPH